MRRALRKYAIVAALLVPVGAAVASCRHGENLVLDLDQYKREHPEEFGGTPLPPTPAPRPTPRPEAPAQ